MARAQSIPALKSDDGAWMYQPAGKADFLAATFDSKDVLLEPVTNEYSDLEPNSYRQKHLRRLTLKETTTTLATLDENSGTGPDHLHARILKYCAEQLAYPVMQLTMLILSSCVWPACW